MKTTSALLFLELKILDFALRPDLDRLFFFEGVAGAPAGFGSKGMNMAVPPRPNPLAPSISSLRSAPILTDGHELLSRMKLKQNMGKCQDVCGFYLLPRLLAHAPPSVPWEMGLLELSSL